MESKQQPSLQNNLLIKHVYIQTYIHCMYRTGRQECGTTSGTEPARFVVITPRVVQQNMTWTTWCLCLNTVTTSQTQRNKKEMYIKYKNVELILGQDILFLPSSYVPGETFGSTQSKRRCWNLWQRTGNQWMFLQILKKMGKNIQYLEFLLNRVNFKTNRTFESCVVTEKWHQTAIKTRFKEFIQHLFHASLAVTLRTLCLTPPSARPRCGNVRLFFITI